MPTKKKTFCLCLLLLLCLSVTQSSFAQENTEDATAKNPFGDPSQIVVQPTAEETNNTTTEDFTDTENSVPLVTADDVSLKDLDKSFSDLALEEITGTKTAGQRNPFAPGVVEDQSDPSSLSIQGIIVTPQKSYALVSGQVFTEGDRIGYYTVSDIKPGKMTLTQLEEKFVVKMEGYSQSIKKRHQSKYFIKFVGADLKQSLEMLATAGNMNIIIPENTTGKISVCFYNTEVMDALASILKVNTLEYAIENEILRVGPTTQFTDDSDLKALTFPLNFATAAELKDQVKTLLSQRGDAISDDRTNTIVVKDHANVLNNIKNFLVSIDRQDPQVSIEAKVIDASINFSRTLGVQWGFATGPNNIVVRGNQDASSITSGATTGTMVNLGPSTVPTSGFNILVGRLPGNTNLEMQLGAAESNGAIRIISKPNVTTINNKTANIRSGRKIYVKVEGGSDDGPTLKEIDTGIELEVTPQITLNRMIKMELKAVQSEADFSRTVDGVPSIIDNTAETTVLVPDGETAVIGGLLRVATNTETRGVPGISKVPILGWLFKNTNKSKESKELMIFITPKILDSKYFEVKDTELKDLALQTPNTSDMQVDESDLDKEIVEEPD